jgi:hypothetical protein
MPAAWADAAPVGLSSIATQSGGCTPRNLAAARYGSGCGFPRVTSSPVTTVANRPAGRAAITASANDR